MDDFHSFLQRKTLHNVQDIYIEDFRLIYLDMEGLKRAKSNFYWDMCMKTI